MEGAWPRLEKARGGRGGLAEAAEQEEGLHVTGAGRQPRTPEGDQHGKGPYGRSLLCPWDRKMMLLEHRPQARERKMKRGRRRWEWNSQTPDGVLRVRWGSFGQQPSVCIIGHSLGP